MLSKRAIAYGAASYALVAILALDEVQRGKDLYAIATNLSSNGWFLASACNAILIAIFTWAWCLVKALVGPIPAADWLRLRESIVPTIFNISMAFVFVNAYHMDFVRFLHVLLLFMFTFIRKLAEFRSENLQTQATTISNTVRFLCLTTVLFTSACGWSLVFLREPQSDTGFGAVLAVDYVSIAIYTVGITLRFLVDIYDKYRGGNWEAKAKVTYYVKIACEVATASAHVILLTLWFKPSALVYRAFFVHGYRLYGLIDNLRTYLKLTHLFETTPDATAEDLAHDAQCSICLDDMQPNQGCKRIPCGHCFHRGCLSRWVERNKTCPYCRQQINLNHAQARPPNPAPAAAGADGPAAPAAPAPPAARNAPGDPFQNAYQQYLDAHRQAMAQQGPRAAPAGAPVREVRLRETQVVTLTNRRVAFDDDEVVIEEEHEEDAAVLDADKARATIRAYKKFARSVQLAQIALERELAGLDGVAVETPDRD